MQAISAGNESVVNLTSAVQLLVDGANNSFVLAADAEISIEVQLGNGANPLANGGSDVVAVFAKVTPNDTADECNKPQDAEEVTATHMLITGKHFWAESGSTIKVFAKSTSGSDTAVGTKVWVNDLSGAKPGDAMNLAADAIKAVSYDESTAFPLKAGDSGATQIARVGADSDTLETLSDEIAAVKAETASIQTETTALDTLTKVAGDGDLAAVLVDTNEIQGKLPTNKFMGSSDGADDDGTLNSILEDTGTTLDGKINTIDGIVDSIQVETTAIDTLTKAAGDGDLAAVLVDTNELQTDDVPTKIAAVQTEVDKIDALDTVADAIKVVTDNLAASATTLVSGTVSHDNTVASTTVFYSDDVTEATADHYNGRIIIFTSGDLQNQATDITGYALDTGEGKFTVTALTEAPADNVTFVIV
ncbi:hypothetical protein KAR91_20780 [Candidatus Pacearchaeota archaeon]|nr:hypothetical protein [Candidatus Pacearchaeota archaeon]